MHSCTVSKDNFREIVTGTSWFPWKATYIDRKAYFIQDFYAHTIHDVGARYLPNKTRSLGTGAAQ
jgi:hypothetical protein